MFSRYYINKRKKYLLLLLSLTIIVYLFYHIGSNAIGMAKEKILNRILVKTATSSKRETTDQITLLNNVADEDQTCKFPQLDLNDPLVLDYMKHETMDPLDCTSRYPLLFDSFMSPYPRLLPVVGAENQGIKSCCYRNITFHADNPFSVACLAVHLNGETVLSADHEYIAIECEFVKGSKWHERNNGSQLVDMHVLPKTVKKREGKAEQDKSSKPNLVILGVDSISRLSFYRTMPATRDYIMNVLNGVELMGMNKVGDNTFPNIGPLLTNQYVSDDYETTCVKNGSNHECKFIWLDLAAEGYQTLYLEDTFTMYTGTKLKLGSPINAAQAPDYHISSFGPLLEKYLGHELRVDSTLCYGPRTALQVALDYLKKVATIMRENDVPYFHFYWSTALPHDYMKGGLLVDADIKSTLKWYSDQGLLENTILILMSDHGARIGNIRLVPQAQIEDRLPFFVAVFPAYWKAKYSKAYHNFVNNRDRLITMWDLHQTVRHIMQPEVLQNDNLNSFLSTSPSGRSSTSLFLPVPFSRSCEDAGVPLIYCTCNYQMETLSTNEPIVKHVAGKSLDHMNAVLKKQPLCAQLAIRNIVQAGRTSFGSKNGSGSRSSPPEIYRVFFDTVPTFTKFDAMLVEEDGEWVPKIIVSADWVYSNHSDACLDTLDEGHAMHLYCFCNEVHYTVKLQL